MRRKPTALEQQLRRAVRVAEGRGKLRSEISRVAGLSAGGLTRFLAGGREPMLGTAVGLAEAVGKRLILVSGNKCLTRRKARK